MAIAITAEKAVARHTGGCGCRPRQQQCRRCSVSGSHGSHGSQGIKGGGFNATGGKGAQGAPGQAETGAASSTRLAAVAAACF